MGDHDNCVAEEQAYRDALKDANARIAALERERDEARAEIGELLAAKEDHDAHVNILHRHLFQGLDEYEEAIEERDRLREDCKVMAKWLVGWWPNLEDGISPPYNEDQEPLITARRAHRALAGGEGE